MRAFSQQGPRSSHTLKYKALTQAWSLEPDRHMFDMFLGAFAKLRKATVSFVMSVCLSHIPSLRPSTWKNSDPTEQLFMKSNMWAFFENMLRKFKFQWNLTRVTGAVHEDLCAHMIQSQWILLRMRNASCKVEEKFKITILCSITISFLENRAIYEIMWKIIVVLDRPQMTISYDACALHAG